MRVGQSRKRDIREPAVVAALQAVGVVVFRISGEGCPDLLCFYQGVWLPLEVKGAKGQLTAAQVAARALAPYPIVRSEDDALALFGIRS